MNTHSTPPRRRLRRTLLAASALALLAVSGCAGSTNDSKSVAADGGAADAPAAAPDSAARDLADGLDGVATSSEADFSSTLGNKPAKQAASHMPVRESAIISTGSVTLSADDVAAALFDAKAVVDDHRGQVTDEKTETGDKGEVVRSAIVIRVPAGEFDNTMTDLKKVGHLVSANASSEDVTTQVIDTEVRVRSQEESLRRIETLFARAQSIRDIMAIETQLSRRQADLDSLKQQQAWLLDQTSMSTITVHLKQTPKKAAHKQEDKTGFFAGLANGWDGLKGFTNAAATVIGVLLPFAAVVTILGVPLWLIGRRWIARRKVDGEPDPQPVA